MSKIPFEEQSVETIPRSEAFAEVYDQMLELADEHLTEPLSAKISTFEDGTFRITVYHHFAGAGEREVLYYHTERSDCQVIYGIESDEEIRDEHVITSIEPPMQR
jgi:dsDNA-binding SOS-regulon protein